MLCLLLASVASEVSSPPPFLGPDQVASVPARPNSAVARPASDATRPAITPPAFELAPSAPQSPVEQEGPASQDASSQNGTADAKDTIVVTASSRSAHVDPLEPANLKSFEITQSVDHAVVAPVAMGYRHIVPGPIRDGLHNAFANLDEPVVFLNFLIQHKVGKAAETVGRFAVNTTLGAAGLFDIAKRKPFRLPHRPNGFADSFGFYGVKPGAFLFLPVVGPTTVRDLIGGLMDRMVLPTAIGVPFNRLAYSAGTGVPRALDRRIRFDADLREQRAQAQPYVTAREYYLRRRQDEIDVLRGKRKMAAPTPDTHKSIDELRKH